MVFNGTKPWLNVRKHTIDKVDVSDLQKHYNLTPGQLSFLLSFTMRGLKERSNKKMLSFI